MAKIKPRIDDYSPDIRLLDERGATKQRILRAQKHYEIGDTGITSVRDSPLERALSRKVITRGQYEAGAKFRVHWYHAGLSDSLQSIDLNRIFASDSGSLSGMAKTENQVFHRQRFREARDKIGDKGAFVLEWMICREEPLDRIGFGLGWKNSAQAISAATEQARTSLDDLCGLWGIDRFSS